jgi:hypothetical protein
VSTDGTCLNALLYVPLHYISRDQPTAHELTKHILQASPAPARRSPGAPGKLLRRWWGIVPVSPTGTTGIFPDDILNGYDVKNWLSVFKFVQDSRANGFQLSCDTQLMNINIIISIMDI